MAGQTESIELEGQRLILLPERAVYWPSERTLIVADLHWGKTETFHRAGIPIPPALFDEDLQRLSDVLEATDAQRVIVLGDLIHGSQGLTEGVVARMREWRQRHPVSFVVTAGNHDRSVERVRAAWDLEIVPELKAGPFVFRHEPEPNEGYFTWCGHLHPTYVLSDGADSVRLPCFHLSADLGVVPSFSQFTRGLKLTKSPGDRVFIITDQSIVEIP